MPEDMIASSNFRISDLYHHFLNRADQLLARWKDKTQPESERDQYRQNAWQFQTKAGYLAHAIARFGDLPILQADLDSLEQDVISCTCAGTNPWMRALRIIRHERSRAHETQLQKVIQDVKEGKLFPSTPCPPGGGVWTDQQVADLHASLERMLGNRGGALICK